MILSTGREDVLGTAGGELNREGKRLFRRLIEPGYFVRSLKDAAPWAGLFGPRNSWRRPVLKIDMKFVAALHRTDLLSVEKVSNIIANSDDQSVCFVPSKAGEAWWRRAASQAEPFRTQHQAREIRQISVAGKGPIAREVNAGESPLGWLSKRKGGDGKPFLSPLAVEAGERLRHDFTLAGLSPKVTTDWSGMFAHVDQSRSENLNEDAMTLTSLDARKRFDRAIAFIGPGLDGIVVQTCCHLQGLEEAERRFGWPQRSAKIVLKIALDRLASHYGLGVSGRPTRNAHVWQASAGSELSRTRGLT